MALKRQLTLLPEPLAVCRLAPGAEVPAWATGSLVSITRTAAELSIVCAEAAVPAALPEGVRCAGGWRALEVAGPLDFALTGILAGIALALAEAEVSLFAISTFDTDYILIQDRDKRAALSALRQAGYRVDAAGEEAAGDEAGEN